nr:hypothetical protein [Tanacetum cinerariifolium]
MALWTSQREDHTSEWLRTILISGLGQTMNGKTYRCVLCYRLGILLFFGSKPCSRVFAGDIYGDHVVSYAGIIGIKHRHNFVRDTLVDICYRSGIPAALFKGFRWDIYGDHVVSCAGIIGIKHRHTVVRDTLVGICYHSGISAGKEVDIGLDGGRDKPLRPPDLIRKRDKYMDKCAAIGYGFLPFSFSSLGELEASAVILLKRIRKFSITRDIGARAAIQNFNRIGFVIPKGVRAQIVSRLPSNFL